MSAASIVETTGTMKIIRLTKDPNVKLGMTFVGGADTPIGGVFANVTDETMLAFTSGLRTGDRVLSVNSKGLIACTVKDTFSEFRNLHGDMEIIVLHIDEEQWLDIKAEASALINSNLAPAFFLRPMCLPLLSTPEITTRGDVLIITAQKRTGELGCTFQGGANSKLGAIFVDSVTGLADNSKNLWVGDRVLEVNGLCALKLQIDELIRIIGTQQVLQFTVLRLGHEQWRQLQDNVNKVVAPVVQQQRARRHSGGRQGSYRISNVPIVMDTDGRRSSLSHSVNIHPLEKFVLPSVTDMRERLITLTRVDGRFGFSIIGADEMPRYSGEPAGCYVNHVFLDATQHAGLRQGDQIRSLEGRNVTGLSPADLHARLSQGPDQIKMIVSYQPVHLVALQQEYEQPEWEVVHEIDLIDPDDIGLGINIIAEVDEPSELFISDILPGGVVEKDGRIRVGDQIVAVNGTNTTYTTYGKLFY